MVLICFDFIFFCWLTKSLSQGNETYISRICGFSAFICMPFVWLAAVLMALWTLIVFLLFWLDDLLLDLSENGQYKQLAETLPVVLECCMWCMTVLLYVQNFLLCSIFHNRKSAGIGLSLVPGTVGLQRLKFVSCLVCFGAKCCSYSCSSLQFIQNVFVKAKKSP